MYEKALIIKFRSLLRNLKINRIIESGKILKFLNKKSEEKFERRLFLTLKGSKTIFDVGANIGYYLKKFCNSVGQKGEVFAFEQITSSAIKIKDFMKKYNNLEEIEYALRENVGNVQFSLATIPESPNNKFKINNHNELENFLTFPITTIDEMAIKYEVPDLIKIDVEGYKLNFLKEAKKTLKRKKLKDLFTEIYFNILKEKGPENAPIYISNFLKDFGCKIKCTVFSHLYAFRNK